MAAPSTIDEFTVLNKIAVRQYAPVGVVLASATAPMSAIDVVVPDPPTWRRFCKLRP